MSSLRTLLTPASFRRLAELEAALLTVFKGSASKHEANERARPIMEQASRDPAVLTAVIEKYLQTPGALDKQNYPVVGMDIALNPWFGLVANCWIPLPGRETHVSTKMIHHHGDMLLSTATIFGPGYEHWMFSTPRPTSGTTRDNDGIYGMTLLESAAHPLHHVSFVDSWVAHTPLYPKSLSVTLALWSSQHDVTWRDRAKRIPFFKGREEGLRKLAVKLGLKRGLALKIVESFDYFPTDKGFQVMRERKEFELGPNEDHLCSVFHVVQGTGNEHLSHVVRRTLDRKLVMKKATPTVERLLADLEKGRPIEGKLSTGHYGVSYANFTRDDIRRALAATERKPAQHHHGDSVGRELSS